MALRYYIKSKKTPLKPYNIYRIKLFGKTIAIVRM